MLGLVATLSLDLRLNSVNSWPPAVLLARGNILLVDTGNLIISIYLPPCSSKYIQGELGR